MLSLMPFTPRYAIFYAIYPKICYHLCHIPRSSAIFFLNVMLQYITLTPSYANSSYAMFSGQSRGRISGYCCTSLIFDGIFRNNSSFFFFGILISKQIVPASLFSLQLKNKTPFRKNITEDSQFLLRKSNVKETPKSYIWKKPKNVTE